MTTETPELYYVHDPMCSWCYAFASVWDRVREAVSGKVTIKMILGGLAPDSDVPMPEETRQYVRGAWQRIESVVPGTQFNYDFWERCEPRRSTYPACRAVIAAREQGAEYEGSMIAALQRAYYREARNPSLSETLSELAGELGLDVPHFEDVLASAGCDETLQEDLRRAASLGIRGLPTLILIKGEGGVRVRHDFNDADLTTQRIDEGLVALSQ